MGVESNKATHPAHHAKASCNSMLGMDCSIRQEQDPRKKGRRG